MAAHYRAPLPRPTANICANPVFMATSAANQFAFCILWTLARFPRTRSFVFNTLQTLLPKTRGGVPPASGMNREDA